MRPLPAAASILALLCCVLRACWPVAAQAQHITIDGSLSPAQTLVGPAYTIGANLGKQVGGNLFQSFGIFGLSSGESATFTGPASVSNVIGRVTGGSQSSINGAINSTIQGANIYLINPAGMVFGPGATINVSGSFRAASADYLRLSDGSKFQATNPGGSTLSAAAPAAFGFLNAAPPSITVNGSTLSVPAEQTLGLVGGGVSITGATLSTPGGTIHVTSVAGTGEVPVAPGNGSPTVTAFGPVAITSSLLNVSDMSGVNPGGSIYVRSGTLTVDNSAFDADNYANGPGGVLSLSATNQMLLTDNANIEAAAVGAGTGADMILRTGPTGSITINDSFVAVGSLASGNSGQFTITGGQLTLQNEGAIESLAISTGNSGAINIALAGALNMSGSSGITTATTGTGNAGPISIAANTVTLDGSVDRNGPTSISSLTTGTARNAGNGGSITIANAAALSVSNGALIASDTTGAGSGGSISVAAGQVTISTGAEISADTFGTGAAGSVALVATNSLALLAGGEIESSTDGSGNGGAISVSVAGPITINGTGAQLSFSTGILAGVTQGSTGNAGNLTVSAATLSMTDGGQIASSTFGAGTGGAIQIDVAGLLTVDGSAIAADTGGSGNAGSLTINAGNLTVSDGGEISASTAGTGAGGTVSVTVPGLLSIVGSGLGSGIAAIALPGSGGNAGNVVVDAGALSITTGGEIAANAFGAGNGGTISVNIGSITLDAGGIDANAEQGSTGKGGDLSVNVGTLTITDGGFISTSTLSSGSGGTLRINVTGDLTIEGAGLIAGFTSGAGAGGNIVINSGGAVTLSGAEAAISATSTSSGNAGQIALTAGSLSLSDAATISTSTFAQGTAGAITVSVAGALSIDGSSSLLSQAETGSTGNAGQITVNAGSASLTNIGVISSSTFSSGNAGDVMVTVAGPLSVSGSSGASSSGIFSIAGLGSTGDAGQIAVNAGTLSVTNLADISTTTLGQGSAGDVTVTVAGLLAVDGSSGNFSSGIFSEADPGSTGNAGEVTVSAGLMTVTNGGQIGSSTFGKGNAGDLMITVAGSLSIDGVISGLVSKADPGSTGNAGQVTVNSGSLTLTNGAQIGSGTFGPGNAGGVTATVAGLLSIDGNVGGVPSGLFSEANLGSTGNAGQVTISAGSMALTNGGQISTSTFAQGSAGDVTVTVAGLLSIDGFPSGAFSDATSTGNAGQVTVNAGSVALTNSGTISTSASGQGNAGDVTVAAGNLSLASGARVQSLTAGSGAGGNVTIDAAGDVALTGPTTQITAQSTASGDAGAVNIAAANLSLNGGASVTTEALTANGGNITLAIGRLLYLQGSEITTAVDGAKGNGGNILIDPQFVVLNDGDIIANAVGGNGGNITIDTGQFIPSIDAIVSASSQLGISGMIVIDAPRVDLNGSLTVLSDALRHPPEIARDDCAGHGNRPQSSLVDAGRGGVTPDPDLALPALYVAGQDLVPGAASFSGGVRLASALVPAMPIGCQ